MRIGREAYVGPVVLTVVLCLGITGCAAGGSPAALPPLHRSSSAPAVTPSSSPVITASETPATAASRRAAERAAVIAVVRRYYAVLNNLHRDMDPSGFARLFTSSCTCQAQVRAIRRAAAKHEHYIDQATLNAVTPIIDTSTESRVLVDLNASRGGLKTRSGRRVTSVPAATHIHRLFELVLVGGRWLINEFDVA